jgi:ubiquinone/menaquinone biosynthesis C-methylase UbiE
MRNKKINLPYFDEIMSELDHENKNMEKVFGKHVHWGYWENPENADGTYEDFKKATDALCEKVWSLGNIKEKDCVLDVGCGFGGTISSLNDSFNSLNMVGLNIDQRQIDRARKNVKAKKENIIKFVKGSASQLPFEENSFDVILAVECIFHFPDRNDFFDEVQRVLRPGGYFALSDFIISYELPPMWFFSKGPRIPFYGNIQLCNIERYETLAEGSGFGIEEIQEITRNVLPTYPVVKKIFLKNKIGFLLTLIAQITQSIKFIQYKNISFKKK